MKKRILTALLALCVAFTSVPVDFHLHAEEQAAYSQSETEESTEEEEGTERTGETEEPAEEPFSGTEQPGAAEETDENTQIQPDVEQPSESEGETGETPEAVSGTEGIEVPENTEDAKEWGTVEEPEIPEETEKPEETTEEEKPESTEGTEIPEEAEKPEEPEETEKPDKADNTEIPGKPEKPEKNVTEEMDRQDDGDEEASKIPVGYLMVESEDITTPGTQNIVAGLGEKGKIPEQVKLHYRNRTTGREYEASSSASAEDMFLFSLDFADKSSGGIYELTEISYVLDGKEGRLSLKEEGFDIRFGVNAQAGAQPDAKIFDVEAAEAAQAELDASVITLDGQGNVISETKVEDVLGSGWNGRLNARADFKGANSPLKVVLDPGHDSTHAGARYNNSAEETLVLKIAKFCRDELKTYGGVEVYMVREGENCPYGLPAGSSVTCNANRVEYAKSVGANVYVSFHLNASTSSSANGVGVYYPNSNYRPDLGEVGKGLAWQIFQKLRELGLSQWADGILIRDANYDKYPDGSTADYLGVIRRCKEAGIPAVLIEHAFLSGTSDYNNFLSTDDGLKKLGVADATAIAEYYGLKKGAASAPVISYARSQSDGTLELKWNALENVSYYEVYRNTSNTPDYTKLSNVTEGTAYTDDSAKAGKKYYYIVRAVFKDGKQGEYSQPVTGRVLKSVALSYVKTTGSKKLTLAWEGVTGAEGYRILRKDGSDGKYKEMERVSADKKSYTDSVPSNNKEYSYMVQAYHTSGGGEGRGISSEEMSARSIAKAEITSVKAEDEDALVVTWKKVGGAQGYYISRSTSENGTYKRIKTVKSGSTTSYKDKDAKMGQTYYYKVEAYRKDNGQTGKSGASKAVSGRLSAAPKISYVISKNSKTIEIGWGKKSGVWGYRISRSTSSKGNYQVLKTVKGKSTTTYKDTKVSAGKKYYYKVEAVYNNDGNRTYSDASAAKSGMALAKTTITSVKASDSRTLTLKWKKVEGAGGYQIYRSTFKSTGYKLVAEAGSDKVSYKDSGLKAGQTYYYKVRAYKKSGSKKGVADFSAVQKAWTLKKAEITEVKAESGKIRIGWKKISKADGYKVYRSTSASGSFKLVKTISDNDLVTYTDKSVKEGKVYYYRVAATNKIKGSTEGRGSYSDTMRIPLLSGTQIASAVTEQYNLIRVSWNKVKNADGYQLSAALGEKEKYRTLMQGNTLSYAHGNLQPGVTYYYKVRPYAQLSNGTKVYGAWSSVKKQAAGHMIMGSSNVTAKQMTAYFNRFYQYPSEVYSQKGAATADEFFKIVKEEAEAEGVKSEVLFAQVILETGGLRFGGDVQVWQCNFGGLGATGNGAAGETFPDVRTGLRAQVQHLKAYASTDPLNNSCVDTRFSYVTRGSAPYVEWLAIPKNPYGKGWATDPDYGTKLIRIMDSL